MTKAYKKCRYHHHNNGSKNKAALPFDCECTSTFEVKIIKNNPTLSDDTSSDDSSSSSPNDDEIMSHKFDNNIIIPSPPASPIIPPTTTISKSNTSLLNISNSPSPKLTKKITKKSNKKKVSPKKLPITQSSSPNPFHDVFDLVVPTFSFGSLVLCFIGPLYLPRVYIGFLFFYLLTFLFINLSHFLKFRQTALKISETTSNNTDIELTTNIAHAHVFIIPNYKEPLSLLKNTVARLAAHTSSKSNYVLVLAMEETELECKEKADALYDEFIGQFNDILITIHPAFIAGEARGKGSNVNFAVREACTILTDKGIPMKKMMVTVCDSDAAIPELYITQLEKTIIETHDPYSTVFCPPIFFSRNSLNVPAAVRVTDIMWSIMVMQNFANSRGLMFPCSSYTLSMVLADRVNYWDTDFASIGEDMHMMLKCFYKTGGVARAVPIYVPFNFTNVQTTDGYISNIHARYIQAKRHFYGVADVAYALRETANTSHHTSLSNIIDRMILCFHVLEAHLIPATGAWIVSLGVMLFHFYQPGIFDDEPYYATLLLVTELLSGVVAAPIFLSLLYYEFLHRDVDNNLFYKGKKSERSLLNLLDYVWLPISAFFFMTIPSTESSLKRLIPLSHEYVTSEKMEESNHI